MEEFWYEKTSRRKFVEVSSLAALSLAISSFKSKFKNIPVSGHLWIYASNYPPDWNCNPIIDQVFADMKLAGLDGVELMEVNLRGEGSVDRLKALIDKHKFPVTGTSYGADMWNKELYATILKDVEDVIARLASIGGKTFGISVKSPGRKKTEEELNAQADLLKAIRDVCHHHNVTPNLHNHTYEVENNFHDLYGTLQRIPDFPLGPDVGWLAKAGVDPVEFVRKHGRQMVYMHLRDIDAKGEWTQALGEGVIDFDGIARELSSINYSQRAAIELAFANNAKPTRSLKDIWKTSRNVVSKKLK
jgi:sugar phosphate isomerase/epimerase